MDFTWRVEHGFHCFWRYGLQIGTYGMLRVGVHFYELWVDGILWRIRGGRALGIYSLRLYVFSSCIMSFCLIDVEGVSPGSEFPFVRGTYSIDHQLPQSSLPQNKRSPLPVPPSTKPYRPFQKFLQSEVEVRVHTHQIFPPFLPSKLGKRLTTHLKASTPGFPYWLDNPSWNWILTFPIVFSFCSWFFMK